MKLGKKGYLAITLAVVAMFFLAASTTPAAEEKATYVSVMSG